MTKAIVENMPGSIFSLMSMPCMLADRVEKFKINLSKLQGARAPELHNHISQLNLHVHLMIPGASKYLKVQMRIYQPALMSSLPNWIFIRSITL
ncbi:hypothetical protein MAR_022399 [Mya arenaria]|uniref:Uncharacterized protein n=1 Tax=Mya arenaria TaxID=6604 RepID=A0ABY7DJZ5_MYAAR|nr:hypothetical protein MAR_022399 [Mya arenaria]